MELRSAIVGVDFGLEFCNPHVLRGRDHVLKPEVVRVYAVCPQEETGVGVLRFLREA